MKYIFYIAKVYSIPIYKPLVEVIQKNNLDYRFYISEKVKHNFPVEWDKSKILKSLKEAKSFRADFILVSGNFVDFRIPGVKVQIFHGLGVEKPVHYKIRHFFDIYLTSGPFVTERYKELQDKYNSYFDVFETGWPKIDYIINFDTDNLHQKNKIPADKKIILYAPTFSSKMESVSDLATIILQIIKDDEFWILKFHELMNKEQIELISRNLPSNSKIIINEEITPYLHLADIMISDTSSVIYEFLSLNKPVITYKTIARPDKGINIENPAKLRENIDIYLANPQKDAKNRIKHINEINPYLDGKVSESIIKKLEEIEPKDYPKKGKPLNLFRKWQIIYHSIFRKGYLR